MSSVVLNVSSAGLPGSLDKLHDSRHMKRHMEEYAVTTVACHDYLWGRVLQVDTLTARQYSPLCDAYVPGAASTAPLDMLRKANAKRRSGTHQVASWADMCQ
jgi:hypothetical protein